jgi:hypothetical protein
MGTELYLFSPLEDETDKFRENVNVTIQNLVGQNINLDKYKQITENQLNTMVTDCKVFESTILKSSEKDLYKVVYAMTQGKFRLKITSFCYIKNEKAYLTTFSSELSKYEQFRDVAEKILNSFLITE